MIPNSNTSIDYSARTELSRAALMVSLMLTLSLMIMSVGCRSPRMVVIPASMEIRYLPAGQSHHATNDVYLVPPARMQWILHQLSEQLQQEAE